MPKKRKPKFPAAITVFEREYDDNPKRLYVMNKSTNAPSEGESRYQATYKLVGVELVTSKLVVTRKQVKS